jgi:hypothetical protein
MKFESNSSLVAYEHGKWSNGIPVEIHTISIPLPLSRVLKFVHRKLLQGSDIQSIDKHVHLDVEDECFGIAAGD